MENVDSRVTSSLHPSQLTLIEGYDDETAPALANAVNTLKLAYTSLSAVHTAREQAKTNPTWNEAQQILETDKFGDRHMERIAKSFDTTERELRDRIASIEAELTRPVSSGATNPIASEIRAHVNGLPGPAERRAFLREALDAGDEVTLTAVLGTVPYLSGLDALSHSEFTRMYREKNAPEKAKQLKAIRGACDMLDQRWLLVHKEMTKAVGAKPEKVTALRKAKTKAEEAFILRDA